MEKNLKTQKSEASNIWTNLNIRSAKHFESVIIIFKFWWVATSKVNSGRRGNGPRGDLG